MVEVFKTNVKYQEEANLIISQIRSLSEGLDANFDLEDCDRILRVCSQNNTVNTKQILQLVKAAGFHAEVLAEDSEYLKKEWLDLKVL